MDKEDTSDDSNKVNSQIDKNETNNMSFYSLKNENFAENIEPAKVKADQPAKTPSLNGSMDASMFYIGINSFVSQSDFRS